MDDSWVRSDGTLGAYDASAPTMTIAAGTELFLAASSSTTTDLPDVTARFDPAHQTGTAPAGFGSLVDGSAVIEGELLGSTLLGGQGDDLLTGGSGDDVLDGGSGDDTVAYAGVQSDYQIVNNGDGTISITGANTGTDTLSGIETITFDDGSIDLTVESGPVGTDGKIVLPDDFTGAVTARIGISDADLDEADSTEALVFEVVGASLESGSTTRHVVDGVGVVELNGDGTYTFEPATGVTTGSFTIRATDNAGMVAESVVHVGVGGRSGRHSGTRPLGECQQRSHLQ